MRGASRRAAAAVSGRPGQVWARSHRASYTPRTNAIDPSLLAQEHNASTALDFLYYRVRIKMSVYSCFNVAVGL
eukprot:5734875-Pleurochrysis_carterae.AAC.2